MDREMLLLEIKQEIKFAGFNKERQAEIDAYLDGRIEHLSIERIKGRTYSSYLARLVQEVDSDQAELVKRAFRLMLWIYPENASYCYGDMPERYSLYQKMELPEEMVKEEFVSTADRLVKSYSNCIEEALVKFARNQKMGSVKDELSNFISCYGALAKKMAFAKSEKPKEEMTSLILSFCILHQNPEDEKVRICVEKRVYGLLRQLYSEMGISEKFRVYFPDGKAEAFYQSAPMYSLFYDKGIIKRMLLGTLHSFAGDSLLLQDANRMLLLYTDPMDYLSQFDEKPENLARLYKEQSFPMVFQIRLFIRALFEKGFLQNGRQYVKSLEALLDEDREEWTAVYREIAAEDSLHSLPLLAILQKHEETPLTEELRQAEGKLQRSMEVHAEARKRVIKSGFGFYIEEEEILDYGCFSDPELSLEKMDCKLEPYMNETVYFILSAASLYSVSQYCRNLTALFVQRSVFSYHNHSGNMSAFILSQELFAKEKTGNPYKEIAGRIGAKRMILAYLNCGSQKAHLPEFLEFLEGEAPCACEVLKTLLSQDDASAADLAELLYQKDFGLSYKEAAALLTHKSKAVISRMEEFFLPRKEARPYVEGYRTAKNKNTREAVDRLLKQWDAEKRLEALLKFETAEEMAAYLEKSFDQAGWKLAPYRDCVRFSEIRKKDSEELAPEILIQYYLGEYMLLKDVQVLPELQPILDFLNLRDVRLRLGELYRQWVEDCADTKKKNLLIPYAALASDETITALKKQIDTWADCSRGALAAFAARCMALNGGNMALLLLDGIAAKYKNKQVRGAAAEAMAQAASQLGISKEELADRIVPDLGFDSRRQRVFSYGSRTFTAFLSGKLEVSLTDEKGKAIKSLPKAGAADDAELAETAKEEMKGLKKQLKTVVTIQKNRLESALMTGRKWPADKWKALFVENPIMNGFATGLIWEERDSEGRLLGTFRYMEDGSFNTCEEEEYTLSENSDILLLHPMDVEEECIHMWEEQLSDYEVTQPFLQLRMPIYTLSEAEETEQELRRFADKTVYFGAIRSLMERYDWKRTSIIDGGGYEGYYYEDVKAGVGVQLLFEYLYVGMMANDTVKVKTMQFYKAGTMGYGDYAYDVVNGQNRLNPNEIPPKFLSFALLVGELIAKKEIAA